MDNVVANFGERLGDVVEHVDAGGGAIGADIERDLDGDGEIAAHEHEIFEGWRGGGGLHEDEAEGGGWIAGFEIALAAQVAGVFHGVGGRVDVLERFDFDEVLGVGEGGWRVPLDDGVGALKRADGAAGARVELEFVDDVGVEIHHSMVAAVGAVVCDGDLAGWLRKRADIGIVHIVMPEMLELGG